MEKKYLDAIIHSGKVKRAFVDKSGKFLEIENMHGIVFTVWAMRDAWGPGQFQITMPIVPNIKTGSSVTVSGDSHESIGFAELLRVLSWEHRTIPLFYTPSDMPTLQFMTIDKAVNHHGNILGYTEITIESDRERVNKATREDAHPCVPVSLEFYDEMLGCVPPEHMGAYPGGQYYAMQVGEPSDHNSEGQAIYETFQMMSESCHEDMRDVRMVPGVWYFTGRKISMRK